VDLAAVLYRQNIIQVEAVGVFNECGSAFFEILKRSEDHVKGGFVPVEEYE
jgi:hypothetical protein